MTEHALPCRGGCLRMSIMGAWEMSPWDNDKAADWFGDLFDEIPLARKVEETLKLEAEAHHEEIRAATAMLIMLGRVYIWPIDDFERHVELALERMRELRDVYREHGDDWLEAIDSEIAVLEARLTADRDAPAAPQPTTWKRFWGR